MSSEKPTFKDYEIVVGQHKETKLWHAILNRYNPTPSGSPRFSPCVETRIGYETAEEAVLAMVDRLIVKGTDNNFSLKNTEIHASFLPAVQAYLENPDPNRFTEAS